MNSREKKLTFIINIAYVAVIFAIIYFFLNYVFLYISPFIIAFGVAMLLDPVTRLLMRKLHFKRNISAILCVSFLIILTLLIVTFISSTVIKEGNELIQNVPSYLQQLETLLQNIPLKYESILNKVPLEISRWITSFIKSVDIKTLLSGSLGNRFISYTTQFVTSIPSLLIYIIVTIAATFFTTISYPTIKDFVLSQFSKNTHRLLSDIKFHFLSTLKQYGQAYSLLIFITFAELLIAFYIFGFSHAITFAFFISIIDILPILGVGTILIPWSVIELIRHRPAEAIKLIGIYLIVTVVRQIIEPKIIGTSVGLPPLVTLICIYVGLKLFGIFGMFACPILVIIINRLHKSNKITIWKTKTIKKTASK